MLRALGSVLALAVVALPCHGEDISQVLADRLGTAGADAAAPTTPALARSLEGAVDPETFVLGPGDLLEVVYTGRAQPSERVRVSPSGRINLAPTGPVKIAGLSLQKAEEHLRKILSRYYADTRISLDLLELRVFRVHVSGHVKSAGTQEVVAGSRASVLLASPELVRDGGSERNLVLHRRNGDALAVDLVRYRLLGDLSANPMLSDGDVLQVPARLDSASVFGRVARPGFVEFRAGDTVDDLIELAGGFESSADRSAVELRRFSTENPEETVSRVLDLSTGAGDLSIVPGDGVYVRADPNWRKERLVELNGEVRYPGVYAIEKSRETLRSLIDRAGGFTEDASARATRVVRPGVFDRPEDDPEFQRLRTIPIAEMTNDEYEYLKLRTRQREGLASATLSQVLVGEEAGEDLVLRGGDRIQVPRENLSVDVQGAVRNPGFVPFDESRNVGDYIELAGGISDRARTGHLRIIRNRTGERIRTDSGSPVESGDTVWVPEKADRNWWKVVRETAVFLAQIGTLVVIIDSVQNK